MKKGSWGNWAELLLRYPEVRRTGGDEAHFPLAADGTGIRTMIFFKPGLMRLLRIAPAPVVSATAARRTVSLSHPYNQRQPHDISKTL